MGYNESGGDYISVPLYRIYLVLDNMIWSFQYQVSIPRWWDGRSMLDLSPPAHWNSMGIWKLGLTDWIFSPPPTETRLKYENWASRADLPLLRPQECIITQKNGRRRFVQVTSAHCKMKSHRKKGDRNRTMLPSPTIGSICHFLVSYLNIICCFYHVLIHRIDF